MNNHWTLTACIAEAQPLRYTPSGLPALDMRLEHESQQSEAGAHRQVRASVKAVAFGSLAERLARQALGSSWIFRGFLATGRGGKGLVFHIQDIHQQD
ncbi:primosomal replication protein N [Alicycliphilus denitrificans]|uniref:primosomal replication protein N n=1 Tax=Alicycliphilus denitrificans TaxID=179636 RepID=UPI002D17B044|nr:primosomal replication protein N [Alicycliphilus denitrificans]